MQPSNDNLAKYNKFQISLEYLDVSSRLFLEESFFSSLHLAGAAEEILGKYCNSENLKNLHDRDKDNATKWKSRIDPTLDVTKTAKEHYHYKNAIKHFDHKIEANAVLHVDIKYEAECMLRRAFKNLEILDMEDCAPKSLMKVIEITTIWIEVD